MLGRRSSAPSRAVNIDLLPQVAPPTWSLPVDAEKLTWAAGALGAVALVYVGLQLADLHPQRTDLDVKVALAEAKSLSQIVPKEVRDLQQQVEAANKQAIGLKKDSADLDARQWPWRHVFQVVAELRPEAVSLSSITQGTDIDTLTVEGTTENHQAVLVYAASLQRSKLFADISVKSVAAQVRPGAAPAGAGEITSVPGTAAAIPGLAGFPLPLPAPAPSGLLEFSIAIKLKPL